MEKKKLSEEQKKKISEGLRKAYADGRRVQYNKGVKGWSHKKSFKKGQTAWNKGKSNEWCKGESNHNWKGGITKDPSYNTVMSRKFRARNPRATKNHNKTGYNNFFFDGNREEAIQRDGEKCRVCGLSRNESLVRYKEDLTVHHIDGNGKNAIVKNNDINNLTTVCKSCHKKIHFGTASA